MKVVLINGNMSKASMIDTALAIISDKLKRLRCEVEIVNVRDLKLPVFDPVSMIHPETVLNEDLLETLRSAQGYVIATPEYHGSMTGALKNFFDHVGVGVFLRRPVGLISTGGGTHGGHYALDHMRDVLRYSDILPPHTIINATDNVVKGNVRTFKDPMLSRLNDLAKNIKSYGGNHYGK